TRKYAWMLYSGTVGCARGTRQQLYRLWYQKERCLEGVMGNHDLVHLDYCTNEAGLSACKNGGLPIESLT
ncbi:hypothetical protein Ancab_017225, partial [Ancistrocladus abbreviatus]